ncbi:MAG: TSUP family transporter, partial [Bacillota bacterium]|nr:TSUP family transporter [Bacillota bacterium]
MSEFYRMCLIVCPLVFTAGFVDAIAGGGGLISLPAYYLAGLPAHIAAGTSKMAMSIGTLTAAGGYIKARKLDMKVSLIAAAGSFLGSCAGSSLAIIISDSMLKAIMLTVLPIVAVFIVVRKDFGSEKAQPNQKALKHTGVTAFMIGLAIGCYDGLIGPGTGTFLILAFTAVLGFDLLKSSGCAKVVNLASNIASVIIFVLNGKVLFARAAPATVCAMAGNFAGMKLAIRGGSKYVRYTIFVVIGLLFVK